MSDIQTRRWPNLSHYGVTLGIIEFEGGKNRLVFSDENGKYAHIARNMSFQKTKWPGLWVRDDTRLEPSAFRPAFPLVKIEERSNESIATEILSRIRSVVETAKTTALQSAPRVSSIDTTPDSVMGQTADPMFGKPAGVMVDLSPLTLIAAAYPLGMNHLGEDVFQSPDGKRFARERSADDSVLIYPEPPRHSGKQTPGRYLRGDSETELALAADGFVRSMAEGHLARVDDFAQFFRAVNEREMAENDGDIDRVAKAIDIARVRRLSALANNPDADAFGAALRLHEAAQYYTLVSEKMTPLPVGIVMQHIASAMPSGSTVRTLRDTSGEFGIFMQGAGAFAYAGEGQTQDILLSASVPTPLERSFEILGTSVARMDHSEVLQSLDKMSTNGLGLFVLGGDGVPGRIGMASRRFLDALATHYHVEGIVDMDGALSGTPGAPPSRVIVVGAKRETPGHGGLPTTLPYVTDYESLWAWGNNIAESIKKPGSVPFAERGGVATDSLSEVNMYQAPYIPTSMLSDPAMMVPRNMASPLRRAMLEILRENPRIDEYLATQLDKTPEELQKALSAEQADAVILGLKRQESGLGFMEADQTGVGKGRVLASLALASKLRGEPVVFMTEKSTLFTDFWRDIEDIGADHLFKNIFVMNADVQITSMRTGEVVAKSASREDVAKALRAMKLPEADIVFCTYSQFNRDPVKAIRNANNGIVLSTDQAQQMSAKVAKQIERINNRRMADGRAPAKSISVDVVDELTNPENVAALPLEALKPLWIGKVVGGATLIMDESHNAAGEVSQTNLNMVHAVMRAKNCIYSSATFARGERNMRIYRRLFPASVDVENLHSTLMKGGEPLQEALTSMLAEDGALVRREHDCSMLKFVTVVDKKRVKQNEKYADQLAEILSLMTALSRETRVYSDAISDEMKEKLIALNSGMSGASAKRYLKDVGVVQRSPIGNTMQTLMRVLLTVRKIDLAIEQGLEAMRQGQKPVWVIHHTLEAEMNRAVERSKNNGRIEVTDEGVIIDRPGFRQLLRDSLQGLLDVSLDGDALELEREPQFAVIIREIEAKIALFPDLSTSPIDMLREGIEKEGFQIAELSGRKRRITTLPGNKVLISNISPKERKTAVSRFNNGNAEGMILTPAGNSGISLHASPRFMNLGQRVMIEVEAPSNVVERTQFFGRVNRNGQVSHPIIVTLSCGLPAEERLLAMINNSMRKMSASVTGNRDNAALNKDIADILNVLGNRVACNFLIAKPDLGVKLDINLPDQVYDEYGDFMLYGNRYVSELFMRMINLYVADQRKIIEEITTEFNILVEELDAAGTNPLKAKFYDINATIAKSEPLEIVSQSKDEKLMKNKNAASDLAPAFGTLTLLDEDQTSIKKGRKSCFDSQVNISEIQYVEHFHSMTVFAMKKEIRNGHSSLITETEKNYGREIAEQVAASPDTFFETLIDLILDRRESLMQHALSKKHATVADAFADESSNLVKTIAFETEKLVGMLSSVRVGARISYYDRFRGEQIDNAIIVGVRVPDADLAHHAGRYSIKIIKPGSNQIERMSLATLARSSDLVFHGLIDEAGYKSFSDKKVRSYEVSRSVLDGNLFRAAEMSLQTSIGTQATYTDEHGMIHRAVVLPYSADASCFSELPLRIHEPDLATSFFQEVTHGELFSLSTKSKMNRGLSVRLDGFDLMVSVPGSSHWTAWLRNQPALMAITGRFDGTRDGLMAMVPISMAAELIRAIYDTGTTLYAHPDSHVQNDKQSKVDGRAIMSVRQWFTNRIAGLNNGSESTEAPVNDTGIDPMEADMGKAKSRKLKAA